MALVIRRAKVPVVPVVIVGSWEAWPKGRKLPYFRPIRVLLGAPMNDLWKLGRDEIIAELRRRLKRCTSNSGRGIFRRCQKACRGGDEWLYFVVRQKPNARDTIVIIRSEIWLSGTR